MAIIEKEKALDVVRQMVADGQVSQEVAEKYFHELKESENERIRKAIIDYFRWNPDGQLLNEFSNREVLAWLEKQGEQKPEVDQHTLPVSDNSSLPTFNEDMYHPCTEKSYDWSEEDEKEMATIEHHLNNCGASITSILWLKSLKDKVQPKQEWSEEDKEIIDYLIDYLESELDSSYTDLDKETFTKEINWLKSLIPQNRWKPTKRQLLELSCVISGCSFDTPVLVELEEDLKKLREG